MEIIGTNFSITVGSWRIRFGFAVEDVDVPPQPKEASPHHVRIISEDTYSRREA
ncbi:MAG TPA: hypothetical protein VMV65_03460 [Alphaproteobacteria bacterium]|nr:hypothetical protein [Alphaproteobacteria bacterium]